mmetsp:Transcript_11618/g.17570  ORF Transcript_11618/g.17570 Transcript_11618/m.17570 type:complete len:510 (+) Transcript_11618:41-1570(+)
MSSEQATSADCAVYADYVKYYGTAPKTPQQLVNFNANKEEPTANFDLSAAANVLAKPPAVEEEIPEDDALTLDSWDVSIFRQQENPHHMVKLLFPDVMQWKQEVSDNSNYIDIKIHVAGGKDFSEQITMDPTDRRELQRLVDQKERCFKKTLLELLEPYSLHECDILNAIIEFHGQLAMPVHICIDLLPFLHEEVRDDRESLWKSAQHLHCDKHKFVVLEFSGGNLVKDFYDDIDRQIVSVFNLESDTAYFRLAGYKGVDDMGEIAMMNITYHDQDPSTWYHTPEHIHKYFAKRRKPFTKLYLQKMLQFASMTSRTKAFRLDFLGIQHNRWKWDQIRARANSDSWGSRSRCWSADSMVLLSNGCHKRIQNVQIGDELKVLVLNARKSDESAEESTAKVTVKIESILDREYEMVCVEGKMWITPYHAYLNDLFEWVFPYMNAPIVKRYQYSIFNLMLSNAHIINVDGVWSHTLGHDFKGPIIEHPLWGSSKAMYSMWQKYPDYPDIVETI